MHAIAWELSKPRAGARPISVAYMSAETFMYRFINAIRNQSTIDFKLQLRSVDVLMIDDLQFLQGKTFESSTPLGPWLVTPDEPGASPSQRQTISCDVDGVCKQDSVTGDLLFGVPELVSYLSKIFTLLPGDVIATGTPGGVGMGRTPPEFLSEGSIVVTRIDGVGVLSNRCVREQLPNG